MSTTLTHDEAYATVKISRECHKGRHGRCKEQCDCHCHAAPEQTQ